LGETTLQITSSWREEDGALAAYRSDGNGILRVRGENVQALAFPTVLPGSSLVVAMAETRGRAKIWLGTASPRVSSIFADGRTTHVYPRVFRTRKINCLFARWRQGIVDRQPVRDYIDGMAFYSAELSCRQPWPASRFSLYLRDHDGNVWAGTTRGLFAHQRLWRFRSPMRATFGSGGINALFEGSRRESLGGRWDAAWSASETAHL